MNPISNEFSVAKGNLLFDKAKAKLDEITRFKDVLKTEQKKVNNLSLSNKTVGNNKLMNACYEFESIFVNQMFKVMRST
ncbi:MAG: hypothetical protein OEV44_15305, partial [Spirochaetota bacterium]|nr:hypothetical protein [Spirochaetota bacterium]